MSEALAAKPLTAFFVEVLLFALTMALGLVSAFRLNQVLEIQEVVLPAITFEKFILYFLLLTIFISLLTLLGKSGGVLKTGKKVIFKVIFILAVAFGGMVFFSLWLPDIFSLILISLLIFWRLAKPSPVNHNLCVILGIAGVSSFLGLGLEPLMVIWLLFLFSVYDFIAVYKTKHMIRMAKDMMESGVILALLVPQKTSDLTANLKQEQLGGRFLVLGGGDVAFPLIFASSLIPFGISNALIVALFSLIGLTMVFLMLTNQKTRQPLPALPPIALFSIIGYLLTLVVL